MARPTRPARKKDWRPTEVVYAGLALALATTALVVGGQRGLAAIRSSPSLRLNEVVVRGTCLLAKDEVSAFCGPLIGKSIFALNLRLIARTVETHPMVKHAVARRMLPMSMVVTVQERRPVGLLVLDERLHGIDEQGVLLPPFKPSLQPNLPLLVGWRPDSGGGASKIGEPLRSEGIAAAIGFLKAVEDFDASMVYDISEVRLDRPDNLTFFLVQHGIRVCIGKGSYQEKIASLKAVLSELGANLAAVRYIDLRFEGQVVVGQKNARSSSGAG